jgi:hypothetical protein
MIEKRNNRNHQLLLVLEKSLGGKDKVELPELSFLIR